MTVLQALKTDQRSIGPGGAIILGGSYGSLAVVRSLGRQGMAVGYFSTQESVAQYSRYVTHHIQWAGPGGPDALATFIALCQSHGMGGWLLLPSSDHDVQFVTQNYDALAQHFALVTMPWQRLEALNDKARLYELADRLGVGFPRVYWDGESHKAGSADIRFPVVIKPTSTERINPLTKAKAWKAETRADYDEKFALATGYMGARGFVVQEMIPGDGSTQFSYAGLWDHGREICGMTARRSRQFPAEFGTSPFVEAVDLPDVAAEAQGLLKAVAYHGLVEMEFKLDRRDNQLKLLDVNTRIWAWIGLGEEAGLDFPVLAARLSAGMPMPQIGPVRYGVSWRHPVPNTLSLAQSVLRGEGPGYAGLRSLFSRSVSSVLALDDLRPVFNELLVQIARKSRSLFRR